MFPETLFIAGGGWMDEKRVAHMELSEISLNLLTIFRLVKLPQKSFKDIFQNIPYTYAKKNGINKKISTVLLEVD